MSYKKRKKRRSIKKYLRIGLISFILLYLIFRSIPILFSNNLKTTLAKVDTLKDEFQCQGVLIKTEDVFLFDGDGIVEKKIDEGERVPVGMDIANVNFLKDISNLKYDVEENNISYKAEISGIISYEVDGYEKVFSPEKIENLSYIDLDLSKKIESRENFNAFKIMDNFTWYVALKIDNTEDIIAYEEGDFMEVNFLDHDNYIDGKIIKINKTGDKAVVILRFRDYFHDYYKVRFPQLNILKSNKKGYKISKDVVLEKEGQKGVFIKDFNGIVKFKPISIIGEENDYIYLDMGKLGYIETSMQKESLKTIGPYDEIFLKPNRVKEGQIVN